MPAYCSDNDTTQRRDELLTLEKEAVIVVHETDSKRVKVEVRVISTKKAGHWAVVVLVFKDRDMRSRILLDPATDIGDGLTIASDISLHLDKSSLDCCDLVLTIPIASQFELKDYLKKR